MKYSSHDSDVCSMHSAYNRQLSILSGRFKNQSQHIMKEELLLKSVRCFTLWRSLYKNDFVNRSTFMIGIYLVNNEEICWIEKSWNLQLLVRLRKFRMSGAVLWVEIFKAFDWWEFGSISYTAWQTFHLQERWLKLNTEIKVPFTRPYKLIRPQRFATVGNTDSCRQILQARNLKIFSPGDDEAQAIKIGVEVGSWIIGVEVKFWIICQKTVTWLASLSTCSLCSADVFSPRSHLTFIHSSCMTTICPDLS